MIQNKTISLVLPCRNEGTHLQEVIARVPDVVDEIIVVSNKSTDDTVSIAQKLTKKDSRLVVLQDDRTIQGIGYGYAHMTGIQAAKCDFIIGADGDATYPIENIEEIVNYFLENNLDFVSCNRYPLQNGVHIPFKLQLGVNVLNWETRILYGLPIKDILSGMWVFKSNIREELDLTMGDWNLSPQIKINAGTNKKIRFREYSIAQSQRLGETKQNYFRTGMQHLWWIFKNRFIKQ